MRSNILIKILHQFKNTAKADDHILKHFFHLHFGVLNWIDKYELKYDWLVDYAYYFLYHFGKTPKISVKDVPIWPSRYTSATLYRDFEFKADGWWASGKENASKYKARVRKEFEDALEEYMISATLFLGLEHKTKYTRRPSFEAVGWLVRRVFFGHSAERIVEDLFPKISEDRTASKNGNKSFEGKKKDIEARMKDLAEYNLPVS